MQAKKLISISALTLAVCVSTPYAVRAGGAPPSAGATGAASVKGIVKFEGTVPKPKLISMSADPSCAKEHPSPVFAQEVMTDSKGDLQNVVAHSMLPRSRLSSNRKAACTSRTYWRCGRISRCM
jgi:hypothetical protein